MAEPRRPVVLVFVLNYLPGFKAGGVLRTVVNTIDWLRDDYDFRIVTRDRDLGDTAPYATVRSDRWELVDGTPVRYLQPSDINTDSLLALVAETAPALIHLNSFFDPTFTLRLLWARKLGRLPKIPVLVSPRGEFGDGSLKLKYPKKRVYMAVTGVLGLFHDVIWHATSALELQDIIAARKINDAPVRMALDLPSKIMPVAEGASATGQSLRIVFLSRLSREKNLDFALRVLQKVQSAVIFDIYGPEEDKSYWQECQKLMAQLPSNVVATFHGPVSPASVVQLFSGYDLFFFPSKGENYGHVIAESISAGTRVLLSTATPWHGLAADGLGWDVDLKDEAAFIAIIEQLAAEDSTARAAARISAIDGAQRRLLDPATLAANRALFDPAGTGVAQSGR